MTSDNRGSSRLVWWWCVAYTAVVPRMARERRRAELRSHLWEFEQAGLSAASLRSAALRGVASDLTWAVSARARWLAAATRRPELYVVLAALFPVQGALATALRPGDAGRYEAVGGIGGCALLCVAGVTWLVERRRSRGGS